MDSTATYEIIESRGSKGIRAKHSANVLVFVQRGLAVKDADLATFPPRTILVDGVYDGPPFLDNENMLYSLDHHRGVVRAFTLSSCEQALLLVLKGFNLSEGQWQLYANDPDLDAVLALWTLVNHDRIMRNDNNFLNDIVRMVRLEGIIDANGFSVIPYLGFSDEALGFEMRRNEALSAREKKLKAAGEWGKIDFVEYTREMFVVIDEEVFKRHKKQEIDIPTMRTVPVGDRHVFVICRSPANIYEVEQKLKARFNNRLLGIVQEREDGRFTVKLCDEFFGKNLVPLYDELNRQEKAANVTNMATRWGGSDTIGGSPRNFRSTLSIAQIAKAIGKVFRKKRKLWYPEIFRRS